MFMLSDHYHQKKKEKKNLRKPKSRLKLYMPYNHQTLF